MEDENEHDFEQITNQKPSLVQGTCVPTKQFSNLLPIGTELVQPVQFKLIYLFPKTSIAYV